MKKMMIMVLSACLLSAGCFLKGTRHHWKIMTNSQLMLIGEPLNVAYNLYGQPTQEPIPQKDGGNVYLWKVDRTDDVQGVKTISSSSAATSFFGNGFAMTNGNGNSYSYVVKGSWCIVAVRTNTKGIIIKTLYDGYNYDGTNYEPECLNYLRNSKKFCKQVIRETENWSGDCYRQDFTKMTVPNDFSIPQEYLQTPTKKKTKLDEFLE